MSKIISFVFAALFSFSASASVTTILCSGSNQKGKPVVLKIVEAKTLSDGFKSVNIEKVILGASNSIDNGQIISKPLDGCDGALLAGVENGQLTKNYGGDLYIECAGDGDAGVLKLKKKSNAQYAGTFIAPNGKASLGLGDEEEVSLNCKAK